MDTMPDRDDSIERVVNAEESRKKRLGFGLTEQGLALRKKYCAQLADKIAADRALGGHDGRRHKQAWGALKDIDDDKLASRLLVAGISVAASDGLGVDDDGVKNCRDIALWIGRNFDQRGELADRALGGHDGRRHKQAWGALKDIDDDKLASRLLVAGISVAASDGLGVDDDGVKNCRDIALWIGRNFDQRGELALRVGAWGITMLLSLPFFGLDGDILILLLTDEVDDLLNAVLERAARNNPLLFPLAEPPQPWTRVRRGGLPPDHWARVSLIREHNPSIENAARRAIGTGRMRPLLDAVNALQSVPLAINRPVLDFLLQNEPPAPSLEPPPVWQRERFEEWQKTAARLQAFLADTATARAIADWERFFIPLNIDFRGRLNPIPHFNFTREDHIRALFLFADGKPIGEEGLLWLKAHVAARADGNGWTLVQKPSDLLLEDRVAWTETNLKELRSIGEAVLRGDDPAKLNWALSKLKEPYQFVAACVELALDVGPDFITRLPLTFDATCSGLQHLCAMTRAEEGRYANLVPADEADDFYRRVAYRAYFAEVYFSLSHWGLFPVGPFLMKDPFDREIVKQPAMSYFYGSRAGGWNNKDGRWRPYGMTKQIANVLKERQRSSKGAAQLARAIYDVIEDMVPKAKAARDFLEQLVKVCAKAGKPLRWTTVNGLSVINEYHEPIIKHITVFIGDRKRHVPFVIGEKEPIWKDKAVNSVTANFVHSADAAHLQLVAPAAAKEGIAMVSVHDCLGGLAPRAGRLNAMFRERFVWLHKRHNLLNQVRESVRRLRIEPPPLPRVGNLEIEQILESTHAFK